MIISYFDQEFPEKLLHLVIRKDFIHSQTQERVDIIPPNNIIQLASLHIKSKKEFQAHVHLKSTKEVFEHGAQESWFVLKGKVEVYLYDLNDQFIGSEILDPGDISITLDGGHSYRILEPETFVYEFKTGPYVDAKSDKRFIKHDKL